MALVKRIEKRIRKVEGFNVVIRHEGGRDLRGDRTGIPMYDSSRMAKGTMTVSNWKEQRFRPKYPGFEVDILDGAGNIVAGNTLLSSVRDSYSED